MTQALVTQVGKAGSPLGNGLLQAGAGVCTPAHVGNLVLCSPTQGVLLCCCWKC